MKAHTQPLVVLQWDSSVVIKWRPSLAIGCAVFCMSLFASTGEVSRVTVKTRAKSNPNPYIWYRVPCDYRKVQGRRWRTLVIFGGRNCSGEEEVSGKLGWLPWADKYGVFLVAPGFKDDRYWEPAAWSGKALLSALAEMRKSYDIDTEHLLYYGYSAGSQAANLFAAWRPDLCRAWVSHACGVFHTPSARMRRTPGLVTCGDADTARDILSRDFVARARAAGQSVIWKSFPNHPHDVPPGSLALARAFLTHYDALNRDDLGYGGMSGRDEHGPPMTPFVGDDPDGMYWPAGSAEALSIPPEDRVPLPSRAVAEAWGKDGVARIAVAADGGASATGQGQTAQGGNWVFSVDGVGFVCRAPSAPTPESRIAVLFGGRGWLAERTLRDFGFDETADANGLFLLSPSFKDGEYWRPETGTGRTLHRALDAVRRRHGLKPLPCLLYGYSAGGQCAALFADFLKGEVSAWGAHGCGVYPEKDVSPFVPALVTCGEDDEARLRISRQFAYRRREAGGAVLWRSFPCGHALDPNALDLARAWLAAFSGERPPVRAWGEDDTMRVRPVRLIDPEFRNPLYSEELEVAWRK